MKWLQVEIRVQQQRDLEICLATLWELGSLGIQEDEEELALEAFFESDFNEHVLQAELSQSLRLSNGLRSLKFKRFEYDPSDWIKRYRETFEGFSVTTRIYVHPSWEQPSDAHEINILIDPGHGFGTGTHESTRLCLQALTEEEFSPRRILDVGTGSGILAVAAAKLFPRAKIVAVDTDFLAVKAARQTFEMNSEPDISIFNGSVGALSGKFDLIVANLTGPILKGMIADLERLSANSILLSGLTRDEQEGVLAAFRFTLYRQWTMNGWVCFLLRGGASVR